MLIVFLIFVLLFIAEVFLFCLIRVKNLLSSSAEKEIELEQEWKAINTHGQACGIVSQSDSPE